MSVYSTSFFSGTVSASSSTTVGLSSLAGVVVIRAVLVATLDPSTGQSFQVATAGGDVFLVGTGISGPFSLYQDMHVVIPPSTDLVLSTGPTALAFWLSGYLLTS